MPSSGFFIVNKTIGLTSHDVVGKVRRLVGQRRVGHAGTLDPMATGVLIVCLGQATRLIEYLMAGQKQYRATVRFGLTTDTLDTEGQIISQKDPSALTENKLRAILPQFVGQIEQLPPIFSAIKKDGQPLYKRARAGEEVMVDPRPVTIYALDWVDWQLPDLIINVTCSPGTYIRSLARDLGESAGVGAHLAGLVRTRSGDCLLTEAVTLGELEKTDWLSRLQPLDRAIAHLPHVILSQEQTQHVQYGRKIVLDTNQTSDVICAYTPTNQFLAILTPVDPTKKLWQPKKVFLESQS